MLRMPRGLGVNIGEQLETCPRLVILPPRRAVSGGAGEDEEEDEADEADADARCRDHARNLTALYRPRKVGKESGQVRMETLSARVISWRAFYPPNLHVCRRINNAVAVSRVCTLSLRAHYS